MNIDLKDKDWKDFLIDSIFTVSTGASLSAINFKKGEVARVTATDMNNGITDYYEKIIHKNYKECTNFISFSFLGSVILSSIHCKSRYEDSLYSNSK